MSELKKYDETGNMDKEEGLDASPVFCAASNSKLIAAAARRFSESTYPDSICVLLGGSAVHGTYGPFSDVDVIVVSRDDDADMQEKHQIGDLLFDVRLVGRTAVRRILADSVSARSPVWPSLIASSFVISGNQSEGDLIISLAAKALSIKLPPIPLEAKRTMEDSLRAITREIQGNTSRLERMALAATWFSIYSSVYSLKHVG